MKLLVDLNLFPRWIEWPTNAGFEARHWPTAGELMASDSEVMAYAAAHRDVVLTRDLDFSSILAVLRTSALKRLVLRMLRRCAGL
jgi:predicted nuclease of predicted toxin-antitoxin system